MTQLYTVHDREWLPFLRNGVRQILIDENLNDLRFEDHQIETFIQSAVVDLSRVSPWQRKSALGLTANVKEIDISCLRPRMSSFGTVGILQVFYPVSPEEERAFEVWGDYLTLKINYDPDATEEGTLTGTVTFTKGSTAVSGSSTDFDGELEAGDFIKKSTDDIWYEIASVTSDTALVLKYPSYSNGADSVGATCYGSKPVYVKWACPHEVNTLISTLDYDQSQLVIDGGAAYAMMAWGSANAETVSEGGKDAASKVEQSGKDRLLLFLKKLDGQRRVMSRNYNLRESA